MNEEIVRLIDSVKSRALAGETADRSTLVRLLSLDPDSPEVEYMGRAAREVAREVAGNRGKIWAAIGVDYCPCMMNCNFCSFGAQWGVINEANEWDEEKIIRAARRFVAGGASWVTLRTTQFYGVERLMALVRRIRSEVPGSYEIVVNTGEFDLPIAESLKASGADVVYHALRLGEGRDTAFDPRDRLATLDAVRRSPLRLASLVEPVGVEHTPEEMADVFLTNLQYGASLSGSMARVNIPGTPFGCCEALPERRLAQVVAVTRLGGGRQTPDICVHPPSLLALEWGANLVVVETGAIPRGEDENEADWQGFGPEEAKALFAEAGYEV